MLDTLRRNHFSMRRRNGISTCSYWKWSLRLFHFDARKFSIFYEISWRNFVIDTSIVFIGKTLDDGTPYDSTWLPSWYAANLQWCDWSLWIMPKMQRNGYRGCSYWSRLLVSSSSAQAKLELDLVNDSVAWIRIRFTHRQWWALFAKILCTK